MLHRVLIAVAVAASIGIGIAASPTAQEPDVTIQMGEFRFNPDRVTIDVGQTIEWSNPSAIVHTVTADPRRADDPKFVRLPEGAEPFNSGDVQPRNFYRRKFTVPGTYRYFCIPHQGMGMIGTIVVEEASPEGE